IKKISYCYALNMGNGNEIARYSKYIENFYNFYFDLVCLSLYKEESDISDLILLSKSFVSDATIDYDK
ncbi:hypothetical protein, partial [Enterococcus avium]|uniref:hypothetical protein n=1 Tax=Enterococcus avium TaxID=33945 RepID=UPI000B120064